MLPSRPPLVKKLRIDITLLTAVNRWACESVHDVKQALARYTQWPGVYSELLKPLPGKPVDTKNLTFAAASFAFEERCLRAFVARREAGEKPTLKSIRDEFKADNPFYADIEKAQDTTQGAQ